MSFDVVKNFETKIAEYFGSPYAVAVDCCTHGLELCLRLENCREISVPKRTYLSVPMLASKLNLQLRWREEDWEDYYYLTDKIIDAAVLWKRGSYLPNTYMCVSFQFKKHLSLGRGGVILLDDKEKYYSLKKMSYDGRIPDVPWVEQDIDTIGYHYYMTPETAELGLQKLPDAIKKEPRKWKVSDWADLTQMKIFKENK